MAFVQGLRGSDVKFCYSTNGRLVSPLMPRQGAAVYKERKNKRIFTR